MAGPTIQPFLLFEGNAGEAVNFYASLFAGGKIIEIIRYGANEPGGYESV